MYLLDSNVVSELRRPKPHGGVVAWMKAADDRHLFLGAPSVGEIQAGIEITREHDKAKAAELEAWLEQIASTFNILPMDAAAFRACARLMDHRSDALLDDAMIASIALVHELVVVTRNVKDFAFPNVATLNPFRAGAAK